MSQASSIETIMRDGPVIPVIVIRDRAHAVPLARALVAGGVRVLEVTLRTEAALDAIRAMRAEVPEAIVGAGTVLSPQQLRSVAALDVAFAVSPGMTEGLVDAAGETSVPLLPGVATAGEVMKALDLGYRYLKFFPAEPAGGMPYLKALASPLPEARFCPTGGIDLQRAARYLALENVLCVGGSWLVPHDAMADGDWQRITELAREAALLGRA